MSLNIRIAQHKDLDAIVAIYNQAIQQKGLTADLDEQNVSDKTSWFEAHQTARYPIFVACKEEQILGWISLSPYREGRKALQQTAELSLYIDTRHLGQGIGSKMMEYSLETAKGLGFKHIIAILIGSNSRSVALFEKFKFERWGLLPSIVQVDDKQLDHLIYGKHL